METILERNEKETRQFWQALKFIIVFLAANFAAEIWHESLNVDKHIFRWTLIGVGMLLIYWIPPRPSISYPRYLLFTLYLIASTFLFSWLIDMVSMIWKPLIVALILFVFFSTLPLVAGRIMQSQKQEPFGKWILYGLLTALGYGTLMYLIYFLTNLQKGGFRLIDS